MPIKMIITDLDRTLLRTDKTISAYTANILTRCGQKGVKIVFATARPKRTVTHFTFGKTAPDALILHNGAVVYIGGKLHTCFGIEPKARDIILMSLSRDFPNATLSVEIDDRIYANFDVGEVWNKANTGVTSKMLAASIVTDFTDLPDKPADKIIIGGIKAAAVTQYIPDNLYIETSSGDNVNLELIMNRKATKWESAKITSAHFNIPTDQIAAFGDDYNDISMLKNCGTGIAVANAIEEAKAAADYICGTNDNDGVAKWLEENVL